MSVDDDCSSIKSFQKTLKCADDGLNIDSKRWPDLDRSQKRDLLLLAAIYDQSRLGTFQSRWNQLRRLLRFGNISYGESLGGAHRFAHGIPDNLCIDLIKGSRHPGRIDFWNSPASGYLGEHMVYDTSGICGITLFDCKTCSRFRWGRECYRFDQYPNAVSSRRARCTTYSDGAVVAATMDTPCWTSSSCC